MPEVGFELGPGEGTKIIKHPLYLCAISPHVPVIPGSPTSVEAFKSGYAVRPPKRNNEHLVDFRFTLYNINSLDLCRQLKKIKCVAFYTTCFKGVSIAQRSTRQACQVLAGRSILCQLFVQD